MNPVVERKLRALYDLIDARQYKKALKQCNAQLQKSPQQMLYAVKALILQRLGDTQECLEILEGIHEPKEPPLVDLMVLIYRGLNMNSKVTQLHKQSFESSPNRETGELLFNSYAADYNFSEQHSLALKLFKNFGDLKYGQWAVESMCLSAMKNPAEKKVLDIAGLFLQKIKQNPQYKITQETLKVELKIEELKGNFQKGLKLLEDHGSVLETSEKLHAELTFHKLSNEPLSLIQAYHRILSLNLSEETSAMIWDCYVGYVEFCVELAKNTEFRVEDLDCEQLSELFRSPQEALESGKLLQECYSNLKYSKKAIAGQTVTVRNLKRTCSLAELEFIKALIQKKVNLNLTEKLKSKLVKYLSKYYDIPSTVEDLKVYILLLNSEETKALLQGLESMNLDSVESLDEIRRVVTYWKLKYRLGLLEDWEDFKRVLKVYTDSLKVEAEPKKGEHKVGDPLVLIASGYLSRKSDFKNLDWKAVASLALLDLGVNNSPFNYFEKLELISLYKAAGFLKPVLALYSTLDIKSVQHETLGFLVFDQLNEFRLWKTELLEECNSVENFQRYSALDLADSTQKAFTHHNILQVYDFYLFKDKVQNSYLSELAFLSKLFLRIYKDVKNETWEALKNSLKDLERTEGAFNELSDTSVLKDYQPFSNPETPRNLYGRWSNLSLVQLEKLSLSLAYYLYSGNTEQSDLTLGLIKEKVQSLSEEGILKTGYELIGLVCEICTLAKCQNFEEFNSKTQAYLEKLTEVQSFVQSQQLQDNFQLERLQNYMFLTNTVYLFWLVFSQLISQTIPKPSRRHKKKPQEAPQHFTAANSKWSELLQSIKEALNELKTKTLNSFQEELDLTYTQEIEALLPQLSTLDFRNKLKEERKKLFDLLSTEVSVFQKIGTSLFS